jgi:hypothetical protein
MAIGSRAARRLIYKGPELVAEIAQALAGA